MLLLQGRSHYIGHSTQRQKLYLFSLYFVKYSPQTKTFRIKSVKLCDFWFQYFTLCDNYLHDERFLRKLINLNSDFIKGRSIQQNSNLHKISSVGSSINVLNNFCTLSKLFHIILVNISMTWLTILLGMDTHLCEI